jgi:excisionase family DNA binding protein
MPGAKATHGKRAPINYVPEDKAGRLSDSKEVLTLGEAASYLRVREEHVSRLADLHELPGRKIGGEWRFLKAALQDWLRTPGRESAKEAFLALAGAWKDDPDVEEIVRDAHRRRGRPAGRGE